MYDSNICVFSCAGGGAPLRRTLFFFLLRGGVLAQWMHLVEVDILICMLEDYCQYVFSCLLPLLCLQLTFFSKLFFLCLTHTTGSGKNKVCLLNMFMVTSRRGTSRVEIEERKKVRAAELRKCSVCVTMCLCVWVTQSCAQTLLISSLWFLWLMRGYTCTNLTFFSLFLCCFCHCWCDASLYTDVVALRWFFSQFMCSCSFPVAPSSGWSRSTPPPRSYSLYSSPLSVALARFPHYSLSHTPLFVCVLCGCALMGGSYSVGLRLAGKGLRGLAVRCV